MPDNNYSSVGYPRPTGEENKLPQSAENEALAALAARTTGALARKKSDGTFDDGPMDFTVANDFDPSVTGLAAPLRSTAITLDGSKAWTKRCAVNTGWRLVNQGYASEISLENAIEFGLTIPASPKQRIVFRGFVNLTASDYLVLRFDGRAVTATGGNNPGGKCIDAANCVVAYAPGAGGVGFEMRIGMAIGGTTRIASAVSTAYRDSTTINVFASNGAYKITAGAVASVGIRAFSGEACIASGSILEAEVTE